MDKKQKFSIWYVLLGIWVVLIVHNLIFSAFAIKTIPFLSIPQPGVSEYSQDTAKLIDEEVKSIISRQYQTAEEILKQLQGILGKGAKMLLENEKIEGEELRELLAEARDYFSKKAESTNATI
jgi:hypothetical protein